MAIDHLPRVTLWFNEWPQQSAPVVVARRGGRRRVAAPVAVSAAHSIDTSLNGKFPKMQRIGGRNGGSDGGAAAKGMNGVGRSAGEFI